MSSIFNIWDTSSQKKKSTKKRVITTQCSSNNDTHSFDEFEFINSESISDSITTNHNHNQNPNHNNSHLPIQKWNENEDNINIDLNYISEIQQQNMNLTNVNLNHHQKNHSSTNPTLNICKNVHPELLLKIEVIDPYTSEAIEISPEIELRCHIKQLERERDQLQTETLQLKMRTQNLTQNNKHIIKAQQQQLELLNARQAELQLTLQQTEQELKDARQKLTVMKNENDRLKQKLLINEQQMSNGNNSNNNNSKSDVNTAANFENVDDRISILYICLHCQNQLFSRKQLLEQIQINEESVGCLVDKVCTDDITLGPRVCKRFSSGLFSVNQVFCDGCLNPIGWKIIEAFEEWNSFRQGKFCIETSTVKEVTIVN